MKIVSWLITVILLLAALCFALNNRQSITVSLWPFGVEMVAPRYLLTLGTLFLGLLLGAVIGWISHLPHRMETMRMRRAIADLREKVDCLNVAPSPDDGPEADDLSPPKRRLWRRGL